MTIEEAHERLRNLPAAPAGMKMSARARDDILAMSVLLAETIVLDEETMINEGIATALVAAYGFGYAAGKGADG